MIQNIQAMRGVAAVMVFLSHLFLAHGGIGFDDIYPVFWWFGPSGVDIFFVISGFVVGTSAHRTGVGSPGRLVAASTFAIKRCWRIYPVYWAALLLAVAVSPWVSTTGPLDRKFFPEAPFVDLIFLASPWNEYVMLAWSLAFEVWFYLVLTILLLIAPKKIFHAIAAWAGVASLFILYGYVQHPEWSWIVYLSPFQFEFIIGCLVAYVFQRGVTSFGWTSLAIGLLWYAASIFINKIYGSYDPRWRAPLFGFGAGFIIYGLVALESQKRFTFPRFMLPIGSASYSIYIWHQIILFILVYLTEKAGLFGVLPGYVIVPVWAALALGVGFTSYFFFERASMRWFERKRKEVSLSGRLSKVSEVIVRNVSG